MGMLVGGLLSQLTGDVVVTGPLGSSHVNAGLFCTAGFRFNEDGSIDDIGPAGTDFAQINAGEWWSNEPQPGVGNFYEIRCVSLTSGTWSIEAESVGVWTPITDVIWRVNVVVPAAPDTKTCQANFEIRKLGGSVLETFSVSATASN